MAEEIIAGDDVENIVGALTSALVNRGRVSPMASRGGARTVGRPQFNPAQLANQVGGTRDNALRAQLGMGSFTFTSTTGTTHTFIVEPQEAFRVGRIVVSQKGTEGTEGTQVGLQPLIVGSLPQAPSSEYDIPAEMYSPDATDAQMDAQICPAGTKMQLRATLVGAAIAEGDSITVTIGLSGTWIRG